MVDVPEVTSAALSATGAQDGWLNAGDTLSVTLNFDMAVTVLTSGGTPTVTLDVGGSPVQASYVSGSGTSALVFSATIASPTPQGSASVARNPSTEKYASRRRSGVAANFAKPGNNTRDMG